MELLLMLGIFVVAFWGVYGGYALWFHKKTNVEVQIKTGPMLASLLYCGVFLSIAALMMTGFKMPITLYGFLMIASIALLYAGVKVRRLRYWCIGLPVICYGGVFLLSQISPDIYITWYSAVGYALFWAMFIGLFVMFDRAPCCSFIQGLIWGGSAFLGLLALSDVPIFFTVIGSVLFIVIWSLNKIMAKLQMFHFGYYLSLLASFLWGSLFTFALMNGAYSTVVLMLNAYIFALTFGIVLCIKFMKKYNISHTGLGSIFSVGSQELAIHAVLMRSGLLSALGILLWNVSMPRLWIVVMTVMLIVFIDLYNRLLDGGAPAPTLRQLISSTYNGVKEGLNVLTKEISVVKNPKLEKEDFKQHKTKSSPEKRRFKAQHVATSKRKTLRKR